MKIHILSDLHNEFVPYQPNPDAVANANVIVLAGDIDEGTKGLDWARDSFPKSEIIYVAGNHEFYRNHWDRLLIDMRQKAQRLGIHFLENQVVMLGGLRFLGATLWTDYDYFGRDKRQSCMRNAEEALPDFRLIKAPPIPVEKLAEILELDEMNKYPARITRNLKAVHTLQRHQKSVAWLKSELPRGDPNLTVVVTHHYPHRTSCAPEWANSNLTSAFGSNLPNDVLMGAALWIHGHTHYSCNYRLGDSRRSVRVVSNPRGYPKGWLNNAFENGGFDTALLVNI